MLKVVKNEPAIRRHQRHFVRGFKPLISEVVPVELGYPGASIRVKVAWSERLGIWFFSRKIADHRYWNAFGVGRPEGGSHISITWRRCSMASAAWPARLSQHATL